MCCGRCGTARRSTTRCGSRGGCRADRHRVRRAEGPGARRDRAAGHRDHRAQRSQPGPVRPHHRRGRGHHLRPAHRAGPRRRRRAAAAGPERGAGGLRGAAHRQHRGHPHRPDRRPQGDQPRGRAVPVRAGRRGPLGLGPQPLRGGRLLGRRRLPPRPAGGRPARRPHARADRPVHRRRPGRRHGPRGT